MSTPFGTELSPAQKRIAQYLNEPRVCVRCEYEYLEIDNFGQHQCTRYHPFSAMFDSNGKYLCCHRARGSLGCVPADHLNKIGTTEAELTTDVTQDDVLLMAALSQKPTTQVVTPNWKKNLRDGTWVVERANLAERKVAMGRQYN